MSTKVKICGITCENDIRILNLYLPDYAGFVFAESKRKITLQKAKSLISDLNPLVRRVGVFVNMESGRISEIAGIAGLDAIQLHGDETQDYIDRLKLNLDGKIQIWKAIRISGEKSLGEMAMYNLDFFLADTYVKGIPGGSGKSFEWKLLQRKDENHRKDNIILAGGLTPDNVIEAISIARPYGVDVSSGVESEGKKDEKLVEKFIGNSRGILL